MTSWYDVNQNGKTVIGNVYEGFVLGHLKPFSSFGFGNSAEYDILYPLSHLIAILRLAAEDSIPSYKSEVKVKKKWQRSWTEQIHKAVKNSRLAWWEWRKAGAPQNSSDPYVQQMKEAKKSLRKEQRREAARIRNQKVEYIIGTENNSKTFFKLIREQRKTLISQTETRTVGNKTCDTNQEICEGWAVHFQNLASPLQNENFDSQYKEQVDSDIECIKSVCETDSKQITPTKTDEVQRTLSKLKHNKAADSMGLTTAAFKKLYPYVICKKSFPFFDNWYCKNI